MRVGQETGHRSERDAKNNRERKLKECKKRSVIKWWVSEFRERKEEDWHS